MPRTIRQYGLSYTGAHTRPVGFGRARAEYQRYFTPLTVAGRAYFRVRVAIMQIGIGSGPGTGAKIPIRRRGSHFSSWFLAR